MRRFGNGYKLLYNQTIESFEDNNRGISACNSWEIALKRVPGRRFHTFYAFIVDDSIIGFAVFIIEYNDDDTFNFLRIDLPDDNYLHRMENLSGKKFMDLLDDLYKEVGLDGVADVLML